MTENEARDRQAEKDVAEAAYNAFGHYLAGKNVTFGCGRPFDQLPAQVQAGFLQVPAAVLAATATPEAPPLVNVAVSGPGCGPDTEQWQAGEIDAEDGVLFVHGGDSKPRALYAPGQWKSAGIDRYRATGPAPWPERSQALERLLASVRAALFASDLSDSERIAAVKAAHDRHCAGFPATS